MTSDLNLDLGPDSIDDGIGSADEIYVPEPEELPPGREPSRLHAVYEEPRETRKEDKAKAGPPRIDEWQDFFSRVVIRSVTNFYIESAFRGIDEDLLSDREIESIRMTTEERDRIAKPFAEFSNKVGFLRKHGRMIISGGGVSDSIIALGMWARRVRRISRKYRQRTVRSNVSTGQSEQAQGNGQFPYQPGNYYSPGG